MNETVREWIAKAEADRHTAERELEAEENPNLDAVCFHAQQCVEKLMKASLIEKGALPPKTHDLFRLNQMLLPLFDNWSCDVEDLRFLARAAVDFRYPGESADREEAAECVCICKRLRTKLLDLFRS